jgi:nitrogen fixation protein FixH
MEKTVVFLPMILFGGFFLLLIVGFFALVIKLVSKSKAMSWKGEIIDKKYFHREAFDEKEDIYSVVVKTEEGKEMKIGVGRQDYEDYKVGDKLEKKKGELRPKRI